LEQDVGIEVEGEVVSNLTPKSVNFSYRISINLIGEDPVRCCAHQNPCLCYCAVERQFVIRIKADVLVGAVMVGLIVSGPLR
jgi:hypothetical protein